MTRFTEPSITGYNSSPPPDDGTESAANQVRWSTHKTKLSDPIKAYVDQLVANVTAGFGTVHPNGIVSTATGVTLTAGSHNAKTIRVTGNSTITLPEAASAGVNFDAVIVKADASNTVTINTQGSETLDGRASIILGEMGEFVRVVTDGSNWFVTAHNLPRIGKPEPFAGTTPPGGRLLLNGDTIGSAASGATHADDDMESLFLLYYGSMADADAPVSGGRGASAAADWTANKTLKLPDARNRAIIGAGTGTLTENVAAGSVDTGADTFTVVSNTDKWITGMAVQLTTTGTLPTGLSLATTYYVIRASATTIQFATTLANALAGTDIDLTGAGSGTHTVTHTMTARAVGVVGGEETHAQRGAEVGSHAHTIGPLPSKYGSDKGGSNGWGKDVGTDENESENVNASSFPTAAMNNMPPFVAFSWIIRY